MESAQQLGQTASAEPSGPPQPRAAGVRANLAVLSALLNIEAHGESLANLLTALRDVFPFDQALVLAARDSELHCLAALPAEPVGQAWAMEPFIERVLQGRFWCSRAGTDEPDLPASLIAPGQGAICLPLGLGNESAALILLRTEGMGGFSAEHIAFARECASVSLAVLVTHQGGRLEAEVQRLTHLADELRQSERDAQHNVGLLKEIVDHLPIALTVQDPEGRFILVNDLAATNLSTPVEALIGASPADFLPPEEAASRREWELGLMESGRTNEAEENLTTPAGEQVWLTSHKPVQILDRTLLVTTSFDITERKKVELDLAERVHFDELTGIPNRILIQEHVDEALRQRGPEKRFALAFIDLDNFKHINDYYSHAIGDSLLVKIARRIAKRLRDCDMLARISGDEFLLFLDHVTEEAEIRVVVDGILHDLKQPFQIESFEVFSSASIGVSVYPDHGATFEELRRNADNAMYRAKAGQKGDAIYFDSKMGQSITARMESEQRLRLAIRDRKFCCAFQPKVDIRTEEVVGFETLIRWRDDDGEIHPPGSFVGLAIELGLIDPITFFVLAEALKSIDELDASFGPDTTISINVAAKQASDLLFMRSLSDMLRESGRAGRIMLELTEEAFLAKREFQKEILPMLREVGVRVSIDDFGTGYSSLGVLTDITADEIKVDRSFISLIHERPRNQSVLRAIESLGNALGMTIVAEGVETFEELAYLQTATRIRFAQGFYFAKPFFLKDATETKRGSFGDRALASTREAAERRPSGAARAPAEHRARSR